MEEVKNDNLIQADKSSLPLGNNNKGSIMTTLMSTHLVKKPNDDLLFKSERPKNDEDIETIETKLTEVKKTNEIFTRENIISNRDFYIPTKKVTDELVILSKDKLDKEMKQKEYEKEIKTDMEIHKKNMEKDAEKIKKYYQRRRARNNNNLNSILVILITIIFILIIILIYLLLDK